MQIKVKTIEVDNKKIKMQIWDTAGQERFRTVIASYFKGSHGVLLIYDVTNKTSFKQLESWLEIIENNASEDILKILIGNKIDLEEDREVTKEEGQSFANMHNIQFMETSAKMNTNVNEAFEALAKIMMEFNVNQKVKATKNVRIFLRRNSSHKNIKELAGIITPEDEPKKPRKQ